MTILKVLGNISLKDTIALIRVWLRRSLVDLGRILTPRILHLVNLARLDIQVKEVILENKIIFTITYSKLILYLKPQLVKKNVLCVQLVTSASLKEDFKNEICRRKVDHCLY